MIVAEEIAKGQGIIPKKVREKPGLHPWEDE